LFLLFVDARPESLLRTLSRHSLKHPDVSHIIVHYVRGRNRSSSIVNACCARSRIILLAPLCGLGVSKRDMALIELLAVLDDVVSV